MKVLYRVCEDTPPISSFKDEYLEKYGKHFSKNLCEWAVSEMKRDGDPVYVTKSLLDKYMLDYNIEIENNKYFDYVYLANMGKFDHWGSAIEDNEHLIKFVKDILDDYDAEEGLSFCRFCADMCNKGIEIDWEAML